MSKEWKNVACRLDASTYAQFREKCENEKSNMNRVMRGLINEYISDNSPNAVTDTLTVDLTKRVEKLEEKENQGWLNRLLKR